LAVIADHRRDARDAADDLLLGTRDHATLLAAYYPIIRQRCRLALRGDAPTMSPTMSVCVWPLRLDPAGDVREAEVVAVGAEESGLGPARTRTSRNR
jgi:hypothetical protein